MGVTAILKKLPLCLTLAFAWGSTLATGSNEAGTGTEKQPNILENVDLYRTPAVPTPSESDKLKNCLALEQEIAALQPQTYSYKPDFYNDPYQGISVWVGTAVAWPAYALSGYVGYLQYQENGRIISAEERIEVLRHLKARNHCFES